MSRPAGPPRDHEKIRDVAERVYRMKLGPKSVESIIRKHGEAEGNALIRRNAVSYDSTAVCFMEALGYPVPTLDRPEKPAPIAAVGLFAD